ncbi:MAG: hypothetical protein OEW13_05435, partial [Nitrospira sp.]|nr:hypothetical protein [Nitrospira sp.]
TIVALRNRVDDIKRAEVEKVLGRLGHLSLQDRELIEGLASSIVNKLIHRTMITLKTEVNSSSGPTFVEAARRFFHLDRPSPPSRQLEDDVEPPPCLNEQSEEFESDEPAQKPSMRKQAR